MVDFSSPGIGCFLVNNGSLETTREDFVCEWFLRYYLGNINSSHQKGFELIVSKQVHLQTLFLSQSLLKPLRWPLLWALLHGDHLTVKATLIASSLGVATRLRRQLKASSSFVSISCQGFILNLLARLSISIFTSTTTTTTTFSCPKTAGANLARPLGRKVTGFNPCLPTRNNSQPVGSVP